MARKRRKRIDCPNCQIQLKEQMNFCYNCGQENHIKRVSVKMLCNDFFSTYFSIDSKLFKSLRYLVTKPSFLSIEYLNGKIEAYLRPIRMYVFISFTFFLLSGLTSSNNVSNDLNVTKDGEKIKLTELQKEFENESGDEAILEEIVEDNEFIAKVKQIFLNEKETNYFVSFLKSKAPILLFVWIPVLAGLFYLFFYKKEYYYIDHLVFALHMQSFLFILLIISTISDWIFNTDLLGIAILGTMIYGFIAARRFYKRKKIGTFFRLSLVGFFSSIFGGILAGLFFYFVVQSYTI